MLFSYYQLEIFLLVLARVLGIFITTPLFSIRAFPASAKTAAAVWISIVLWFAVPIDPALLPTSIAGLFVSLIIEVAIGFLIGFITNALFVAIQAAGEIMDLQMGLSVASSFDPIFGATISIIGRLSFYVAMMVFVMSDGHHMILSVLNQSFRLLPPGTPINLASPALASQMMGIVTTFWLIATQLAGPIILLIFLSDFAFGIVSRVAPQVNVFQLGFQVKPSLGLIGFLFVLPLFVKHVGNLLGTMAEELLKLFTALRM